MGASRIMLCWWPGLSRLWLLGDGRALAVAIAFGGLLNLLLLSSFLAPDVLPSAGRTLLWTLIGGGWLYSAIRSYSVFPELARGGAAPPEGVADRGLFIQAQGEYLRGNWFEAESLLKRLNDKSARDVESHLLLATLYRRIRRYDEASAQLDVLEKCDRAEEWRWEIAAERRMIQQRSADNTTE